MTLSRDAIRAYAFALLVLVGTFHSLADFLLPGERRLPVPLSALSPRTKLYADDYFFVPVQLTTEDDAGATQTFTIDRDFLALTGSSTIPRSLYLVLTRPHILRPVELSKIVRQRICFNPRFLKAMRMKPPKSVRLRFAENDSTDLPKTPFNVECMPP